MYLIKKYFRLFVIIIFVYSGDILTQTIPDYIERNIITGGDSTYTNFISDNSPTDGSIDSKLYFVGPGDKIFLAIRGIIDQSFYLQIDQEGKLFIPKIGLIDLNDKTLDESKLIIKEKVLNVYRNVEIQISLTDFRKIKVTLLGNVTKPATYILNSNSKLLDLILQSYGIHSNTDLRNIKITDKNDKIKMIDLVSFLRLGDKSCNPFLREGDIVFLSKVDKTISIIGAVKNPGTFEFIEGENAEHLIKMAGGFLDRSKTDTLELTRFQDDNKTIKSYYYSYNQLLTEKTLLQRGDRIIIREKPDYLIDKFVTIQGFVKYPGVYKIIKDKTSLHNLILNEAGGFLDDASLKDAYVIRINGSNDKDPELERLKSIPRADMNDDEYDYLKQKSRQTKGKMVIDFEKLFSENDLSENLILERGDEIYVPENKKYITMTGQVVYAGNIPYKPGLNIDDYVNLAGGFGWRALKNDIRVIKSNTGEWIEEDDVKELEPGDIIWVPEDPPNPRFWDVFQKSLNIVGQVATVIAATVAIIIATRK
jgi:protein involved in polysaccharide export with SLBB domain